MAVQCVMDADADADAEITVTLCLEQHLLLLFIPVERSRLAGSDAFFRVSGWPPRASRAALLPFCL